MILIQNLQNGATKAKGYMVPATFAFSLVVFHRCTHNLLNYGIHNAVSKTPTFRGTIDTCSRSKPCRIESIA